MREMESHGEQTHFVKRVVLPSGKTIEVATVHSASSTPTIRYCEAMNSAIAHMTKVR